MAGHIKTSHLLIMKPSGSDPDAIVEGKERVLVK